MNLMKFPHEEEEVTKQAEDVARGYMCTDVEKQEWPDAVSADPPQPVSYRTVWVYYCSMRRNVGVG